jgi:hypothetical protein
MQIQSPALLPGKYYWKVTANDRMLEVSSEVYEFTVSSFVDNKEKRRSMPAEFTLHQNYPNPFNPSTKIRYEIPEAGNVEIKIYDILGNEVLTLVKGFQAAGRYEAEWNAINVSNGIYFCKLSFGSFGQAGSFSDTKKLILLK